MPMDRQLIAPYDKSSGLQNDYKPFIIPEEAFVELNNAYVFRGRVRKRFGSRWLGDTQQSTRLRVKLGTTDGAGNLAGTVPGILFRIGQQFSVDTQIFTVNVAGTPAFLLKSSGPGIAVFNTTTGAYGFAGVTALADVYYYSATPVMGLVTFEQGVLNDEATIAFDMQFAYRYIINSGWERIDGEVTPGAATWSGTNSNFFWGASYFGAQGFDYALFVTNYNQPDFIRFLFNNQWDFFTPIVQVYNPPDVNLGIILYSSKIIVPFKNRLLFFNTWEGETTDGIIFTARHYPFRVRWSQVGSAFDVDAFRQDIPGRGSGLDAPINQEIVTVEFIKDRLIVFFEESTWELVYTGNQIYPFVFQQINTELGAEATYSVVPFDKVALAVGNVGIHACNGSNVERIDSSIPDAIFQIHNDNDGTTRVWGIRDYFVEMVYWALPDTSASAAFPYPNRVLVYNYKTGTWAFNDDSITAFGYFQASPPDNAISWDSLVITWDDEVPWDSGQLQPLFRNVIAGNQEGWTFLIDPNIPINASVIQITNITLISPNNFLVTAIDHNLRDNEFIFLNGITGTGNLTDLNGLIVDVTTSLTTPNTFSFILPASPDVSGTYSGGGNFSRVSEIDILTKQFNFYMKQGRNAYIPKIDFLVDKTGQGQIQVDFYVSTNNLGMINQSEQTVGTGSLLGTSVLDTFAYPSVPFEAQASQVWHPVYFQGDGEFVQFRISLNAGQMLDPQVRIADFQMHAMAIYTTPTASRFQ